MDQPQLKSILRKKGSFFLKKEKQEEKDKTNDKNNKDIHQDRTIRILEDKSLKENQDHLLSSLDDPP
jgi:hypothetical protein